MATVLDLIDDLLRLRRQVYSDLDERAPGLTPHAVKIVEWLAHNRGGTIAHISAALDAPRETTRWSVNRLISFGLARYVEGRPGPGRPLNTRATAGSIELTPAGLRLFDQLRR